MVGHAVDAQSAVAARKPRWSPKPILARTLHGADPDATQRQPIDVRIQFDGEDGHAAVNL